MMFPYVAWLFFLGWFIGKCFFGVKLKPTGQGKSCGFLTSLLAAQTFRGIRYWRSFGAEVTNRDFKNLEVLEIAWNPWERYHTPNCKNTTVSVAICGPKCLSLFEFKKSGHQLFFAPKKQQTLESVWACCSTYLFPWSFASCFGVIDLNARTTGVAKHRWPVLQVISSSVKVWKDGRATKDRWEMNHSF